MKRAIAMLVLALVAMLFVAVPARAQDAPPTPTPGYVTAPATFVTPIPADEPGATPAPASTPSGYGNPDLLPPGGAQPSNPGTGLDVNITNEPVVITPAIPLSITVSAAVPTATEEIPGLVWLFGFIIFKLVVMSLFHIPEKNYVKRTYDLQHTGIFILVDVLVIYPIYHYGGLLLIDAGGLWLVFWFMTLYLRDIIEFFTHLTSNR